MTPVASAVPVLKSKVMAPATRPAVVRAETVARYADGGSRRMLLVRAPAGYGKTTVTADVALRLGWHTAWYRIDLLDHDPAVLVAGLVEAVARISEGFGTTLRDRLADATRVPLPDRELLALLLRAMEEELREPLHLVIDDYHEAAGQGLDEAIDFLVSNMPDGVHVVVISRYEPGLETGRLLLADQIARVGIEELRFTDEQAARFLETAAGRTLCVAEIERLTAGTEGWPAGLVLAARALSPEERSGPVDLTDPRLKGDLFTYLADQVFNREDLAIRAFLKRSCCLEQMTPDLVCRLTGSPDAGLHLRHLSRHSVFTFGEEGGGYRYHRLFRDYLRHKVTQEDGAAAYRSTQLRAAAACEQVGDLTSAVELYFAAGDPPSAVAAMARGGDALLDRSPTETLKDWAERLPPGLPAARPWQALLRGHALMREGQYAEALAALRPALAADWEPGDDAIVFALASAVEQALFWRGEYGPAAAACRQALTAAARPHQRMHALVSLGAAHAAASDWDAAEAALSEAEAVSSPDSERELLRLETLRIVGLTVQGRFREAAARARASRAHVERSMPPSFLMSFHNLDALTQLFLADYPAAMVELEQATSIAERFGYRFFEPFLLDARGQLELARGNLTHGIELSEQAERHPAVSHDMGCRALARSHVATAQRRAGELDRAADTYDRAVALLRDSHLHHPRLTVLTNREYVACRLDPQRRLDVLAALAGKAATRRLPFVAAKCAVFTAVVEEQRGARETAVWRLRQILPTSLDLGHLHFLSQELALVPDLTLDLLASTIDETVTRQVLQALARHPRGVTILVAALKHGEALALASLAVGAAMLSPADRTTLLRRGRRHRLPAVRRLAGSLEDAGDPRDPARDALPELTRREVEILALIAEGKRNADIAEQLVLSPSTVKTYVNRIFSKLGVVDRVQATLRYRAHAEQTRDQGGPPDGASRDVTHHP